MDRHFVFKRDDHPDPGIGGFHATFCVALQDNESFLFSDIPREPGPRN
jgi:hypothetical protein